MAEENYDPFAFSDVGRRALEGEYIDSMRFFWFDPVTGEEGQTTEGYSRVPDSAKPYIYLNPNERNSARDQFYSSGAGFAGTNLTGGQGMGGGLLSGQAYAQQIAGGIPFEQVVAPGMSFSPDQPMGFLAEGATPFVPRTITPPETTQQQTTFFPSVSDTSVGMTGADLGLPMGTGTPMPAGTLFDETSVISMPAPSQEPVMPMVQPMMPVIEPEIPVSLPAMQPVPREIPFIPDIPINIGFPIPNLPIIEREPVIPTTMPTIVSPTIDTYNPSYMGFEDERAIGRADEAALASLPIMTNFTVPQDPILNIENIISPIRTGGARRLLGTL